MNRISRTFVTLADTLSAEFDLGEYLQGLAEQCADLLDVSVAGVLLVDRDRGLAAVAASAYQAELLELFEAETGNGPCSDCFRSGAAVRCADLQVMPQRWPVFSTAARKCGFSAVQALPMRLRDQVVGVLTLLSREPGSAARDDVDLAQAFADVATIGLLQHRTIESGDRTNQQLQTALNSRVLIEQAKGVLAEHGSLSMREAFERLRRYARSHNRRLTELAGSVADGTEDLDKILL
ncbi:transcriptional regulator [Amycolatopsis lurida NRRL 2430]|uniref:Transcriptional regulator n=1 Tax=Amycolatopsis lurida NRRL 2430 TaxID=1460371 RepID=A0A2P2FJX6_AMYLU|nr:transcriptional regulator [Amycolatopsis lurida NRRL 2430]